MISLGRTFELVVVKTVDFGFYLDADEWGDVLLPRKLAPKDLQDGDSVSVFLYLDSEDRPIATTKVPKAQVGEFAYLEVVATTPVGAFLDWGLEKDVLVPFSEQHRPMEEGKSYLVYLYLDDQDGRITASSKIDKFLDDERPHFFKDRQAVSLIIGNTTDLGYKAIVNNTHWGVLHQQDVFQRLSFGQSIKGFIKRVRPDKKLDLTLQGGQETRDRYQKTILDYLSRHDGFSPLNDKSDPQEISRVFGMSKGAFKKSIGGLYKQRLITIEKDGIRTV